jgi:hypothetical protein
MNTPTTELIFPPKLISSLRDIRDQTWSRMVEKIGLKDTYDIDRLALELLIVRWCGCTNCQADSFRAMQGCAQCAIQSIRRFRGSNVELQRLLSEAKREVEKYLNKIREPE